MTQAPLVLTLGDPAGIGPEIIAGAWRRGALADDVVVVGPRWALRRGFEACGLALPQDLPVWEPAQDDSGTVAPRDPSLPAWGRIDARCGAVAVASLRRAVQAIANGEARALVTAPLHKEALAAAGSPFPGHTEMLQHWAAGPGEPLPPVRMMLANAELRVVLVTIHMALREALDALTTEGILETLHITDRALRRMGLPSPRIAVAGVNPHAGEGGRFGQEEVEIVAPAIAAARAAGIDAHGPHPPDTVFMRARHAVSADVPRSPFADAVVAMTHDHGLIPVKYLGIDEGVNITLGLPYVRTSPDHGTAFDIAGTGVADPSSLVAALTMARRLVRDAM